ncbi:MAG: hypothetical protein HUJ68_05990 [Clostridia bacterium]|nr:hypothetical protein [Clostridia bacterium]
MNTILGELGRNPKFIELLNLIQKTKSPVEISGLGDVGSVQIETAINEFAKKPICIITYNEIQAKRIYEDIKYFTDKVVLFPKKEIVTYDYVAKSQDIPYKRIEALNEITSKKNLIVITTIEAIMQKIPSKETLYKEQIKFEIGKSYDLENIKRELVKLGYSRCELIEGKGQFSIRGGILDISENKKTGIRIEFWGDEVDSIREFSITSQRSINTKQNVQINPAHEYVLEKSTDEIVSKILKRKDHIEEDIEQIKEGNYISKTDKYFDSFYENQDTILNYLSLSYCIILDEITKIRARAKNIQTDNKNLTKALIEKEKFVPDALNNMASMEEIEEILKEKQLIYTQKQDVASRKQWYKI